jgi:hypothetical protein
VKAFVQTGKANSLGLSRNRHCRQNDKGADYEKIPCNIAHKFFRGVPYNEDTMTLVQESILIASPPSTALSALERYIASKQNVLTLTVPLKSLGLPSELGISQSVRVSFSSKRQDPLSTGRGNEGMSIEWAPDGGGPFPTFSGMLTLQPQSGQTRIEMNGEYSPPLGEIGAIFDAVVGSKIARATIRILLENLKEALEDEFATFQDAVEPVR